MGAIQSVRSDMKRRGRRGPLSARTGAGLAALGATALLAGCATPPQQTATGTPLSHSACYNRVIAHQVNSPDGDNAVYMLPNERALVFKAGMVIDADGAPKAFHTGDPPDSLDFMRNAGTSGNWWSLAVDANGVPFKQGYNDPAPGFYVSKTELYNPQVSDQSATERYVNAQDVPYVALPTGPEARRAYEAAGLKLGDLAVVYNTRIGTIAYAIYADTSHPTLLGEGSIKLADELGYQDTSPKTGRITARENLYVVFPGSGEAWPRDVSEIKEDGAKLLMQWGGPARLAKCAGQL